MQPQPTPRHEAVTVHVLVHELAPGVQQDQHGQLHLQLGARQSQDRFGAGAQHQWIEHAWMIESQQRQRPRQGHHHMMIFDGQEIRLHLGRPQPPLDARH